MFDLRASNYHILSPSAQVLISHQVFFLSLLSFTPSKFMPYIMEEVEDQDFKGIVFRDYKGLGIHWS